jgi:hypothetical protein
MILPLVLLLARPPSGRGLARVNLLAAGRELIPRKGINSRPAVGVACHDGARDGRPKQFRYGEH